MKHLYKSVCLSVCPSISLSVRRSVGPSVRRSVDPPFRRFWRALEHRVASIGSCFKISACYSRANTQLCKTAFDWDWATRLLVCKLACLIARLLAHSTACSLLLVDQILGGFPSPAHGHSKQPRPLACSHAHSHVRTHRSLGPSPAHSLDPEVVGKCVL